MEYGDAVVDDATGKKVNDLTLEQKKASKAIGIADVKDGSGCRSSSWSAPPMPVPMATTFA